MASLPTTCIICGKRFRMIGDGTQTVEELSDSPHVHKKGQEGDERCMDRYLEQQELEAQVAAKAAVAQAKVLVAEAEKAEREEARSEAAPKSGDKADDKPGDKPADKAEERAEESGPRRPGTR